MKSMTYNRYAGMLVVGLTTVYMTEINVAYRVTTVYPGFMWVYIVETSTLILLMIEARNF